MKIQVFAEGKTEEKVIETLRQFFSQLYLSDFRLQGKEQY